MRHGAPVQTGLMLGHKDMPSSDAGCTVCFERGCSLAVETILCSDLQRARRPAEMIAAWQDLPVRSDPRWRELDFGDWDGADPADLDAAQLAAFWEDPQDHPPPGGECWSSLVERVEAALAEVSVSALIVTHGGAIRAALCCLLGLDYRQSWAFDVPYTALVSVRVWPGEPRRAQLTGLII
nr:histidine phosphatase family protein [Sphingobium subterraneum]